MIGFHWCILRKPCRLICMDQPGTRIRWTHPSMRWLDCYICPLHMTASTAHVCLHSGKCHSLRCSCRPLQAVEQDECANSQNCLQICLPSWITTLSLQHIRTCKIPMHFKLCLPNHDKWPQGIPCMLIYFLASVGQGICVSLSKYNSNIHIGFIFIGQR